ncbi:hypothetical protein J5N97_010838 [Dioscorea zingiberensis]|uniref:Phytocyanin domain-containing protein n=1 Tax=Dioscorea zingiberensis TaxID=325984 RepID=A0A9D5D1V0_9LILI|nr:hypothetical protein J5N97_010838 [Dioscorea zingiberensis]
MAIATIHATEHIVGDDNGWTLNFDYQAWAQGKEFRVGDKLVFKYTQGNHNVYKVGPSDFQACTVPTGAVELTSGNDEIMLMTEGRKWYICGIEDGYHCTMGQKLVIDVLPAMSNEAPAPSPSSWAYDHHDDSMVPASAPAPANWSSRKLMSLD